MAEDESHIKLRQILDIGRRIKVVVTVLIKFVERFFGDCSPFWRRLTAFQLGLFVSRWFEWQLLGRL